MHQRSTNAPGAERCPRTAFRDGAVGPRARQGPARLIGSGVGSLQGAAGRGLRGDSITCPAGSVPVAVDDDPHGAARCDSDPGWRSWGVDRALAKLPLEAWDAANGVVATCGKPDREVT
jgi:hypothetical protein